MKKKTREELAAAIEDVFYHGPTHENEWCGVWHAIEADVLALIESGTVTVSWLDTLRTRPVERSARFFPNVTNALDALTVRPTTKCNCGAGKCRT